MSNELLHAITLVQNLRILSQNQLTPSDRAILALEDCRQQQFAALGALETKLVEAKEWKNAVTRAWLPGEMVPQGSPDSVVGILLISHINRALDPNCSEDARQLENRYMARAIAAETETMSLRTEVARLRSILVAQASATPVPDQLTEGFESPDGFDAKTSTAPAKGSYDFECELWQHKILSAVESGRFSIVGEFPYITPSGANSGKMITRLLDTAENGL